MVLHHDIATTDPPPRWERAASSMLSWARPQVLVLAHCTPTNLMSELEALRADFERGQPRAPRFCYLPPASLEMLAERLERAGETLARDQPLGVLYAERARELALETRICMTAGSASLSALARQRYGRRDRFDALADALCRDWLEADEQDDSSACISDDAGDPHSLLSCMQRAVGEARLPFRVLASSRLAALAATGPGVVYVARGRRMTRHAARRTVLHEIEGHALPRHRAKQMPLGIFGFGSARGSDDQEGRAIAIEAGADLLDAARRRELARRHMAGRSIESGAEFIDTVRLLERDHGAPLKDALRIAARAHRGGGLARELVYLPAYLRVRDRTPAVERVMRCGQIAHNAAPIVAGWQDARS